MIDYFSAYQHKIDQNVTFCQRGVPALAVEDSQQGTINTKTLQIK